MGFGHFEPYILHIVPTSHTDLLVNGGKMGHIKRYALPNAFHSKNPLYILMSLFAKLCTILICKIFENLWYEVIRVRGLGIKWLYSHCYGFQQVDLNQCLASSVFMVRLLRLGGRNPSSSCNLYEKRKIHIYFYTLAPEKKNSHLATYNLAKIIVNLSVFIPNIIFRFGSP